METEILTITEPHPTIKSGGTEKITEPTISSGQVPDVTEPPNTIHTVRRKGKISLKRGERVRKKEWFSENMATAEDQHTATVIYPGEGGGQGSRGDVRPGGGPCQETEIG